MNEIQIALTLQAPKKGTKTKQNKTYSNKITAQFAYKFESEREEKKRTKQKCKEKEEIEEI